MAEPHSFYLQTDPDARLAAGVGGAARFLADAAGVEGDALARWQSSIVAACLEAFEHLTNDHPQLDVILTRFADRIEVDLFHADEKLSARNLNSTSSFTPQTSDKQAHGQAFAGVDKVQYETRGRESVTKLTKYIPRHPRL